MDKIISLLDAHGPLTGRELCDLSAVDVLPLWRMCNTADIFTAIIFGKRFVRFDKYVDGFARLSPSIMREFLTYTVVGLKKQTSDIQRKAEILQKSIIEISKKKFDLAQETMAAIVSSQQESDTIKKHASFLIGGDITYEMAHADARPEPSTGELVNGSDLDIIVVTDGLPAHIIKSLDHAIYQEKYKLIKAPLYREEIDYIIKDIKKVREQIRFIDFKSMVASKILYESKLLYGEENIFNRIKEMLVVNEVPEKLNVLEHKAGINREKAQEYLLSNTETVAEQEVAQLFYTTEEREEIY